MKIVTKKPGKDQQGFTLMEVLIAVLILSIGLLGLASLQANGLRSNFSSYARSQAVVLANDMADRIRANPTEAAAGSYNNITATVASPPDCLAADCSTAQMVSFDIAAWYANLQGTLPLGTGSVVGNGTVFTVSVMWDDDRTGNVGAGCSAVTDATPGCFSTTFIP
jgi:type IV pilus assembly protein PilV